MSAAGSENSAPVFAIGTGRCGTHFLAALLARERDVAAHHEREPLSDAFHRYCAWNRLTVDEAGFLTTKAAGIAADRALGKLSFEASAFLALSTPTLHRAFNARFVLMIRRPDRVVNSLLSKGWYEREPERTDPSLALGYQAAGTRSHHGFSRLAAFGDDGARWARLSRIGKLAYFWRALNEASLRDFAALPEAATRVQLLERFDYDAYRELAAFAGFAPTIASEAFTRIVRAKPGTRGRTPSAHDWSPQEAAEFEAEVAPLAERPGYPWRTSELRAEPERRSEPRGAGARVRSWLGGR